MTHVVHMNYIDNVKITKATLILVQSEAYPRYRMPYKLIRNNTKI